MDVEVEHGDQDVRRDVHRAHAEEDGGVLKGDLLRHLHHDKHDDEVDSERKVSLYSVFQNITAQANAQLRMLSEELTFENSWWRRISIIR